MDRRHGIHHHHREAAVAAADWAGPARGVDRDKSVVTDIQLAERYFLSAVGHGHGTTSLTRNGKSTTQHELNPAYKHVSSVCEHADHSPTREGDSNNRAQTKQLR